MTYGKPVKQHRVGLGRHNVRVFYWKSTAPDEIAYLRGTKIPDSKEFERDYVPVSKYAVVRGRPTLNSIWTFFNDDELNPVATPEGQRFIRDHSVHHTAMSVGDVVELDGTASVVRPEGFEKLPFRIR